MQHGRRAPGLCLVRREAHQGPAVLLGGLAQVEQGDLAARQTQQRDGHDVQAAGSRDHDRVLAPGPAAIRRDPHGQIGRRMVAAAAREAGVDQAQSPILQLDDVPLGIPGIARPRLDRQKRLGHGRTNHGNILIALDFDRVRAFPRSTSTVIPSMASMTRTPVTWGEPAAGAGSRTAANCRIAALSCRSSPWARGR